MNKNISCNVIRDLLPLYKDNVCSNDSKKLVEEHLKTCKNCQKILTELNIDENINIKENNNVLKKISKSWKEDKINSFLNGIIITMFVVIIINIVAYNIIGSKVLPDGTLVEPFFLIPMSYLFLLIALITFVIKLLRNLIKKHKK